MKLRIRMQQGDGPVVTEDVNLRVKAPTGPQLLEAGAKYVESKNQPGKAKFVLLSVRQLGEPAPLEPRRKRRSA